MSNDKLTEEEKRNLEVIKDWAHYWTTRGLASKMVDEIYADSPEIFTPLQKFYYVKKGKSKENWRNLELEAEKVQKREIRIVNQVVRGNTVALELVTTIITPKGSIREEWSAVFLTFDKDGRIISDHSYMPGPPPDKGYLPPGFREAMDKIAQDQ